MKYLLFSTQLRKCPVSVNTQAIFRFIRLTPSAKVSMPVKLLNNKLKC